MSKLTNIASKYAAMAAGFALPYLEEYVDVKKQTAVLNDKITELSEENAKLRKENESLKRQTVIVAAAAAASFVAFLTILLIFIIK
jgi:predicted nuclease with TOPRIM domain